jgi:hypothetical protein
MIVLIRKVKKNRAAAAASTPGSKQSTKPPCHHQLQPLQNADISRNQAPGQEKHDAQEPQGKAITQDTQPPLDQKGKCTACKSEKSAARTYRWKLIIGLIFPFALQALDVTIIASALPWIAVDFGEVAQLNWIISAFNLTSAAFIPFWGQMADIFGRHYTLQACVIVMMVGSALCTGAPTHAFPVLLLGRGIQGMGCAGISVVVRIVLADKVSLEENAKNWTIFTFTAGMSYGIGPVIGGKETPESEPGP